MKIEDQVSIKGYKGFDRNLRCRGFQYEVGKEFTTDVRLSICNSGFHFCKTLPQVWGHYPKNADNRYCEVESLGQSIESNDKLCTNHIRIVRELTAEEIREIEIEYGIIKMEENLGLPTVREIQQAYPLVQVGGSTALFLHGVRLKRFTSYNSSDIDMVAPYYMHLMEDNGNVSEAHLSGNDFDYSCMWNERKVDVRIDPKQRYEMIDYKGFKYRVAPLEIIMEAKLRYAMNGQNKHREDLYEMVGKTKNDYKKDIIDDLPY